MIRSSSSRMRSATDSTFCTPGGDRDGAGAAEGAAEGAIVGGAVDVLPRGDEQLAGVAGRDPEQLGGARRGCRDERGEVPVEGGDLLVEFCEAPRE